MTEESAYDRMVREAREKQAADEVKTFEQQQFLGKALEPFAEKINDEICAGLNKALGPAVRGDVTVGGGPGGASRTFTTSAESPQERARASFTVLLIGTGPEFEDPAKVHYGIMMTLFVKPGPGRPTGNVQTIRVEENYYGAGQPGISEQNIQSSVINELIRVARDGK